MSDPERIIHVDGRKIAEVVRRESQSRNVETVSAEEAAAKVAAVDWSGVGAACADGIAKAFADGLRRDKEKRDRAAHRLLAAVRRYVHQRRETS